MLDKLKRRLGIKDTIQDELLKDFLHDAEAHFRLITGAHSVHSRYEFIIINVASKLYNRKGSEGMSQERVDGYSAHYVASLFDEFMPLLEKEFDLYDDDKRERGGVMFW